MLKYINQQNHTYAYTIDIPIQIFPGMLGSGYTFLGDTNVSPLVANRDYDEHKEIIFALNTSETSGSIYILEDENTLSSPLIPFGLVNPYGRPAVGDLSRVDEILHDEIVIPGDNGDLWVVYYDSARGSNEIYHKNIGTNSLYVSIGNVNDDEFNEVVVISETCVLNIFRWTPEHELGLVYSTDLSGLTYNPASIGDLDGNGIEEIIVCCETAYSGNVKKIFFDTVTETFDFTYLDLSHNVQYFHGAPIIGRFGNSTNNEVLVSYSWFDNTRLEPKGVFELFDSTGESQQSYVADNFDYFRSMNFRRYSGCYYLDDINMPNLLLGSQSDFFRFDHELNEPEVIENFIRFENPALGITTASMNNEKHFIIGNSKEFMILDSEFNSNDDYHFITSNEYVGLPTITDIDNNGHSDIVSFKKYDGVFSVNIYETTYDHSSSQIEWEQYGYDTHNSHCYANFVNYSIDSNTTWRKDVTISGFVDARNEAQLLIQPGVKVRFEEYASLAIKNSNIKAIGDEEEKIIFTPNSSTDEIFYGGIIIKDPFSNCNLIQCLIEKAKIGVSVSDAYDMVSIKNCIVKSNDTGLEIYNASPGIGRNLIIGNEGTGISFFHGANSSTSSNSFSSNSSYEIYINRSSPVLSRGFNDIWNDTGYSIYKDYNIGSRPLDISNNWWGTIDVDYINENLLSNPEAFILEPICREHNNDYDPTELSDSRLLYESGIEDMMNEDYTAAESTFRTLISTYPNCSEIAISFSSLFSCYYLGSGNLSELQDYYLNLVPSYPENPENKILNNLITFCKRKKGEFDNAIADYEEILLNNPTYEDSCYAVIDIGNTYLEAEGRASGRLKELIPESAKKHDALTGRLLASIRDNSIIQNSPSIPNAVLYGNYPNPFNPETTISFSIPQKAKVNLSVFNIKGQKVTTITNDVFEKGKYDLIWSGTDSNNRAVSTGVYFYRLEVNEKTKAVKKCLLLK